jgi:histone deacetylase 1/2
VSCPHTHQQNGAVERKQRHIVETGLTLLAHAAVPFRFWSDAFSTACFLINKTPTRVLNMKTPLELFFKELPDYMFFKVFGCDCWPHLRPYNNRKLEFRSKKCVFLGYSALHKGYKCLHVPNNRVYISRDVIFDKNLFPFSNMPLSSSAPPTNSTPVSPGQFDDAAYSPVLLPNHGAGTGRGARLELLDAPSAAPATPHIDPCMGHATAPRSEAPPSPPASPPRSPSPARLPSPGPPLPTPSPACSPPAGPPSPTSGPTCSSPPSA